MKLNVEELLFGFSAALDAVEGELVGATTHHSHRVAYMTSLMGKNLGLSEKARIELAVAAVLHDNALTQFAQSEIINGTPFEEINIESNLGSHCAMGENNVKVLPIFNDIKGAILYHHERADGSGPFKKTADETPLYARIIHIADRIDVQFDFSNISPEKYEQIVAHINKERGSIYDDAIADLFLSSITMDNIKLMQNNNIVAVLYNELPSIEKDYSSEDLIKLSDMFARIIDFKSPFTTRHSRGIAEKAKIMGEYYGWDQVTCDKLYFAGAVHDVGKLFVDNSILEKPGKLTSEEYKHIQDHATGTYVVLHAIRGIDDITDWASLHHEKLDGSGYPFKKTAEQLNKKERLMACLDIYQALVESRPYKDGMTHEKTMSILNNMVEKGQLDKDITHDLGIVFKDWIEPKA